MTNNNPQIAATSAAIAAIIMAIFSYFGDGLIVIGIAIAGCIATYGLTFAVGFWTITHLSVQSSIGSIILGILTLIMMAIALFNLQLAYKEITHFGITSFRGADLTNTNFQDAKIHHANTSGAIGFVVAEIGKKK